MNERPIDRSKKSNIYCSHCDHFAPSTPGYWFKQDKCKITGESKHYWNRCKRFEWKKDAMYLDEMF